MFMSQLIAVTFITIIIFIFVVLQSADYVLVQRFKNMFVLRRSKMFDYYYYYHHHPYYSYYSYNHIILILIEDLKKIFLFIIFLFSTDAQITYGIITIKKPV